MSHADAPHREPPRDSEPSSSRDQRIEQLLLAGLDRYFAGELEHAIQVWSRVFFLDRGHPRARAYIERARGAIAEHQREAEARGHRIDSLVDPDNLTRLADVVDGSAIDTFHARQTPALTASAASGSVRAARAVLDVEAPAEAEVAAVAPKPVQADPRRGRSHSTGQLLLVVLAALLLFGAGYVVAARDRLAAWWAPTGESELAVPAMAPESNVPSRDSGGRPPTPPQGTAKR